jgi:hypothetical protein
LQQIIDCTIFTRVFYGIFFIIIFYLFSSSCISEFFDAREYSTEDGAPSEYSSDEDFCSDNDENGDDSNSTDDEVIFLRRDVTRRESTRFSGTVNFGGMTGRGLAVILKLNF